MKRYIAGVALALVLAACSSGTNQASSSSDPRADAGCPSAQEESTEELYVLHLYKCGEHSLYVFKDNSARDNWRRIAEQVGGVVLKEGDAWLLAK